MDTLSNNLAALKAKVTTRQQCTISQQDQQKRDDWSRVVADHSEHADFIMAITRAFGKPKRVRVRAGDALVLDSERYGA